MYALAGNNVFNEWYMYCRFSVSASKWQVEFFSGQPNQVCSNSIGEFVNFAIVYR